MRIDHLVWYCSDLAEGSRYFADHLDTAPSYGGEHPGEGTANALLALGPATYLEILGRDPAQDEARLHPEIRALEGHGLYHLAVGGIDLNILRERAARAGLQGSELVEGGRTRPDGAWLGWTCFGIRIHGHGALIPFFIDWMKSEHPALSTPRGGHLADFEVFTPKAAELRTLYGALGLAIKVTERLAPGFTATVESSRGRVILNAFAPVPKGYVI